MDFIVKIAYAAPPLVPDCALGNCGLNDFWTLLGNIFDYLVILAVPLAILGIAIGGGFLILGGANEKLRTTGKEIFWDSILGLVLVAASWLIVNTILVGLGATDFTNPLK